MRRDRQVFGCVTLSPQVVVDQTITGLETVGRIEMIKGIGMTGSAGQKTPLYKDDKQGHRHKG